MESADVGCLLSEEGVQGTTEELYSGSSTHEPMELGSPSALRASRGSESDDLVLASSRVGEVELSSGDWGSS